MSADRSIQSYFGEEIMFDRFLFKHVNTNNLKLRIEYKHQGIGPYCAFFVVILCNNEESTYARWPSVFVGLDALQSFLNEKLSKFVVHLAFLKDLDYACSTYQLRTQAAG